MRVPRRGTRRANPQLQPAQRHRAREQQMVLREDQLLAQIDERELARHRQSIALTACGLSACTAAFVRLA